MPNFDSIVNIGFQKLTQMHLEVGRHYYFDYYNRKSTYSTLMFTDEADVEVSALVYNEHEHENFKQMIDNEANYNQKFDLIAGASPRKKEIERLYINNKHVIVRVKAKEKPTNYHILIYRKGLPILAYVGQRFQF